MSRMKKIKSRGKGVGLRICMIVILLLTAGLLLTCNNPLKDLIAADIFESKASSFQLTISIAGEGTTTPNGTVQVRQYEAITIKADAMEGWEFEGWRLLEGENAIIEDNTSLETTITLTDSDASVQAKFFFLDTTQPETTIETPQNPTNSEEIPVTVSFSEEVEGFDQSDLEVDGAVIQSFSGSGNDYEAVLENPVNDPLTITVSIAENCAVDAAGNGCTAASLDILYDTSIVTTEIRSTAPNPNNLVTIPLEIEFNQEITGFVQGDIICTNCTISKFSMADNTLFHVDIDPVMDGEVEATVPAGVAQAVSTARDNREAVFSTVSDRTSPEKPINLNLATEDDTGGSNTDNITNNSNGLTFTGEETEPGTTIHLLSDVDGEVGTTFTEASEDWDVDVSLSAATHQITATAEDTAGNLSDPSDPLTVIVDTTEPNIPNVGIPGTTASPTQDMTPTWIWESGGNGVGRYLFRLDNSTRPSSGETTSTSWTPSSNLDETLHTLHVWERDDAGNWSDYGSHAIEVDVLPTSNLVLRDLTDNSVEVTDDWSIKMDCNATNVTEWRTRNDSESDFNSWGTWTDGISRGLSSGDGNKTMFAEFQDAQGNVISDSDSILLEPSYDNVGYWQLNSWPMSQTTINYSCPSGYVGSGLTAGEGFVVKLNDSTYSKVMVTARNGDTLTVNYDTYALWNMTPLNLSSGTDEDWDCSSILYIDLNTFGGTSVTQTDDSDISIVCSPSDTVTCLDTDNYSIDFWNHRCYLGQVVPEPPF